MEEKKKVGMSGLNWFLSIIGILFFASFIFLPPVFRAIIEDEDDQNVVASPSPSLEPTPNDDSLITSTLTPNYDNDEKGVLKICTKQGDRVDNSYVIQSKNDDILMFAVTTTTHYQEGDDFTANCTMEASLYQDIPGFYHSCSVDGTDMIVESRVQVSDEIPEGIPISFDLNQNASVLEQELTTLGFTCDEDEEE